jgi:hypothetical protein
MDDPFNIRQEAGWHGAFTRDQAREAHFANGVRVEKIRTERGDRTPIGTTGIVLGSIHHERYGTAYFVEWDDKPRVAALVVEWKIGPTNTNRAPMDSGSKDGKEES